MAQASERAFLALQFFGLWFLFCRFAVMWLFMGLCHQLGGLSSYCPSNLQTPVSLPVSLPACLPGATCYMNSVLQQMFMQPLFRHALLAATPPPEEERSSSLLFAVQVGQPVVTVAEPHSRRAALAARCSKVSCLPIHFAFIAGRLRCAKEVLSTMLPVFLLVLLIFALLH